MRRKKQNGEARQLSCGPESKFHSIIFFCIKVISWRTKSSVDNFGIICYSKFCLFISFCFVSLDHNIWSLGTQGGSVYSAGVGDGCRAAEQEWWVILE